MSTILIVIGGLALAVGLFATFLLRRVVPTNEVHIVQSAKETKSYGKDTQNGNSYYEFPSFLPFIGVTRISLPLSVFDIDLSGYEAYDEGRLPFIVDVKAFFRISEPNIAAARVSNFSELQNQLLAIVQGAVRVILASSDIQEIMQGRSKFGDAFTREVNLQLAQWGVETVKNIELMDIRDGKGSHVISNIMSKKQSEIEMQSRTEVAKNRKAAEVAEIEAQKEIDLQAQAAKQSVGLRTTMNEREVSLARQEALQVVKEQERTTKEKEMEVLKVQELRKAQILKEVEREKAEQQKLTTVLLAEAELEQKKKQAEAISLEGEAQASAKKALELAPIQAQIELAKEIGSNEPYQKYLISLRRVEAEEKIGIQQASALQQADVKIISNTGNVSGGVKNVMDLFSSKGGTEVGAMLEGLAQTEVGSELLSNILKVKSKSSSN